MCQLVVIAILLTGIPLAWSCRSLAWHWAWKSVQLWSGGGGGASSHLDSCYTNYIGYNFTKWLLFRMS